MSGVTGLRMTHSKKDRWMDESRGIRSIEEAKVGDV